MKHNNNEQKHRYENDEIIKFLASKTYVLMVLALVFLTIGRHYKLVTTKHCLWIGLLIRLPYQYFTHKTEEGTPLPDRKDQIMSIVLIVFFALGQLAEYFWPNKIWVLIITLCSLALVVIWSLHIRRSLS